MAFDQRTRMESIMRCGGICPNPACNSYVLGPTQSSSSHASIVEGAHIVSAKLNGPRYAHLDDYDILDNCIPLCNRCHYEVDHGQNAHHYTSVMLRKWRDDAEYMAHRRKGTPVSVPFFDPEKAEQIKQDFQRQVGAILNDMWPFDLARDDLMSRKAMQGVRFGSRGFNPSGWHHSSLNRSPDERIAFLQDDIVASMEKLAGIYQKRRWACYTWIESTDVESFKESRFESADDRQANAAYRSEFKAALEEFRAKAAQFMKL